MFKGMMDKMGGAGKLQEMQQKMTEAYINLQKEHANKSVIGYAGSGAVEAVVSLRLRLLDLKIKSELLGQKDATALEGLIILAVNEALEKAAVQVAADMTALNKQLGLPIS